ncbi:NAD-dependent formate dehydrogenase [Burkholderia latens]|uniref:Formate dehydrogenase n=1 Tax=Burkholderia latens TaxID=488446 RepID=A0A6H9SJ38_9BURK|nr:NAD-dependent formate dehydrogenase [Burkholderia latens]KAB0634341.1 NAD-dependent formate dehydrogenase [Burkholderia latens]VWB89873.1 formate dehydrogenase [Burkholderia latens]
MAKVLCVLYPDPATGYPPRYVRDDIPVIAAYPGGQRLPSPQGEPGIKPGALAGCVSGELGLRPYLEAHGHELVVTSDKDGAGSIFEQHLPDADVVISQPFWPAYLTRERIAKARKLKLALTAGIGSDHVDLQAAAERGIVVAEETFSNSISVAEHVVMTVLALVRNFVPAQRIAVDGGWNIADCVSRSYDLEGMHFGTIGAGRIGLAVLRRLKPFDVHLHYTSRHRLSSGLERELGLVYHPTPQSLVRVCDVINLQCPLYPATERMFDDEMFSHVKPGAYLINTARGRLCDTDAVVRALESGRLAGYGGDVWFPQPAPADHPWRRMPNAAMTPHISGTSLSAQARYAAGTLEILQCFLEGRPIRPEYLIVDGGKLAGTGAASYNLT